MHTRGLRATTIAGLLLAGVALAGCGGTSNSSSSKPTPSLTFGSSPSASASPSPSATAVPPPPSNQSYTVPSATAYAKYVLKVVYRSLDHEDMAPVRALLAPGATCKACQQGDKLIVKRKKEGVYFRTPPAKITGSLVAGHIGKKYAIGLTFNVPQGKAYNLKGRHLGVVDPLFGSYIEVNMQWFPQTHRWMLLDFSLTDGSKK